MLPIIQGNLRQIFIDEKLATEASKTSKKVLDPVIINGKNLTLETVIAVARFYQPVQLSQDQEIIKIMEESVNVIQEIVNQCLPLYGVTSLFGGLANNLISREAAEELQNNLVRVHNTGAGAMMPLESIRAAMLLRANTHMIGASGIRRLWDERIICFLNEEVAPLVPEFGSIGASGDLVPLSYIAAALSGQDERVLVDFKGQVISAIDALEKLGLKPQRYNPKEGLAILNGTSVMTASASLASYDFYTLMAAVIQIHAMAFQALNASNQPLNQFFHKVKNHKGQIDAAEILLKSIENSSMIYDTLDGKLTKRSAEALIQDRYSLRCSPQYLGPLIESMHEVARTLEIEMNSANDNPLIDGENKKVYCGGNFLGEHVSVAMDRLRQTVSLLAKHIDVQIAQLVSPEFSNGLPASLIGNPARQVNIGVKPLQLCGNSIMPYLLFLGTPIADKFATHAEQYNQNINSMGHVSACLARQSIAVFAHHLSIALLISVQALDLRAKLLNGSSGYNPCPLLSETTAKIYNAVRDVIGVPIDPARSFIWDDGEHPIDLFISKLAWNLTSNEDGPLFQSLKPTIDILRLGRYMTSVPKTSS